MESQPVATHSGVRVLLSVYFSGTGSSVASNATQIELFGAWTLAQDVSNAATDAHALYTAMAKEEAAIAAGKTVHLKMRFDGCGVARGLLGTLFAVGLDEQCEQVKKVVVRLVHLHHCTELTVNAIGLSRGGIACLMLAKKLDALVKERWSEGPSVGSSSWFSWRSSDQWNEGPFPRVAVNLLCFDPVPGNFVASTKYLDAFGVTTAWANMDLSACDARVVQRALILYPYVPLPAIAAHAPLMPVLPPGVAIYDVILGCHQGAMFNGVEDVATMMSACIIRNFLVAHGTLLYEQSVTAYVHADSTLLKRIGAEHVNGQATQSTRHTHARNDVKVLRQPNRPYLNKLHYILAADPPAPAEDWATKPFLYAAFAPDDAREYNLCLSVTPQ